MQKQNAKLLKRLNNKRSKNSRKRCSIVDSSDSDSDSDWGCGSYDLNVNNKLCVEINGKDEYESDSSTSTYSSNISYLDDVKPIKIIAKNTNKLQSKVVIGKGLCCSIVNSSLATLL